MKGLNGRTKGHDFERKFCEYLRIYGYDAVTSRSESRRLDDAGVDIVDNTPFYFQLKAVERMKKSYHKILKGMPTEKIPVVIHKKNHEGTIVAMKLEDFANLLLYKNDEIKEQAKQIKEMKEFLRIINEAFWTEGETLQERIDDLKSIAKQALKK